MPVYFFNFQTFFWLITKRSFHTTKKNTYEAVFYNSYKKQHKRNALVNDLKFYYALVWSLKNC